MYGKEVAYVALVAANVEAAADLFERDYGLRRSTKMFDGRAVPMLSVGDTALALFAPGDPYIGGSTYTRAFITWPLQSTISISLSMTSRSAEFRSRPTRSKKVSTMEGGIYFRRRQPTGSRRM